MIKLDEEFLSLKSSGLKLVNLFIELSIKRMQLFKECRILVHRIT